MNRFKDHISDDTRYKAELVKFCLAQTNNVWTSLWHQKDTHKESVSSCIL